MAQPIQRNQAMITASPIQRNQAMITASPNSEETSHDDQ